MHISRNLLNNAIVGVGLLLGSHAIAQSLSSTDLKINQGHVKSTYRVDAKACKEQAGNAKDICMADAKGKKAVAMAELDHQHKPTFKSQYKLSMAKGDAIYDVAIQQCDDLSGNPKDVCVKEAKAAQVTAKTEAQVVMKTSASNREANQVSDEAHADAKQDNQEVREDAAEDKRSAALKVAEEKCDALANTAKETCLKTANAKFGKSLM